MNIFQQLINIQQRAQATITSKRVKSHACNVSKNMINSRHGHATSHNPARKALFSCAASTRAGMPAASSAWAAWGCGRNQQPRLRAPQAGLASYCGRNQQQLAWPPMVATSRSLKLQCVPALAVCDVLYIAFEQLCMLPSCAACMQPEALPGRQKKEGRQAGGGGEARKHSIYAAHVMHHATL